jgi:hypothetical protein
MQGLCFARINSCPWRIANSGHNPRFFFLITCCMRDLILLFVHVVTVLIRLVRPGGLRAVLSESVLLRHQLLMLNRSRHRGPNLRTSDRLITGWYAILVLLRRLVRSAIVVKPSSLLNFHRALVHRKYRRLFSAKRNQAGTERSKRGSDSCRCRNEAAQSTLGMPTHCRADCLGLRYRHQQGRRSPNPRSLLTTACRS